MDSKNSRNAPEKMTLLQAFAQPESEIQIAASNEMEITTETRTFNVKCIKMCKLLHSRLYSTILIALSQYMTLSTDQKRQRKKKWFHYAQQCFKLEQEIMNKRHSD